MQSARHPGRMLRSILLSTLLLCGASACAPRIAINRAALPCSALVPPQLADDVPPADLPPDGATVGDLFIALDQQTGQLGKANDYKRAAIEIVKACEARDGEVDAMLTRRKILGIF